MDALDVSVRKKKHATCTIFSAFCSCVANVHSNHYTSYINLFHYLSPKRSSHFPQLSLSSVGILEEKKRVRVTAND